MRLLAALLARLMVPPGAFTYPIQFQGPTPPKPRKPRASKGPKGYPGAKVQRAARNGKATIK